MQIELITSNRPEMFLPIEFNAGDRSEVLNVIFGDVKRPKDKNRDSHNLGKTRLIEVIDFMFLASVGKGHLFSRHLERFEGLVFFMELRLAPGEFVGIRRSVDEPTRIDLVRDVEPLGDRVDDSSLTWSHLDVAIERAREILDGWFSFNILHGYSYRKAISYFLRSQQDWSDELQLQKFSVGKDRDWKPFVGQLFGYDHDAFISKYALDAKVEELSAERTRLADRIDDKETDLPKLRAELAALKGSLDTFEGQLDAFQFEEAEHRLIRELVDDIEVRIATLNQTAYNSRYDAEQIREALTQRDKLNLERVDDVFREAELTFPEQLKRDYEALLTFRKKVTTERRAALKKRLLEVEAVMEAAKAERAELDVERRRRLKVVDSEDTIEKFKSLQREQAQLRRRYEQRKEDADRLEQLSQASRSLRDKKRERDALVDKINEMVNSSTDILTQFQKLFDTYCRAILGLEGIFSFKVNDHGNLEYRIGLGLDGKRGETSAQGDGTSYKKLLCALFDLALLRTHRNERFFQFTYHDGVLEGLDDRKKQAFLKLIRSEIGTGGLQYILTAISSDLPSDASGKIVSFDGDEVILRLDDTGDDGRLFRGPAF